jgi:hypothetical protein
VAESEAGVSFPRRLRHNNRGKVLANLYKRHDGYRVTWRVTGTDGKRVGRVKDFVRYAEAARFGRGLVKDLAKGRAVELTPGQVTVAATAFKLLQDFNADPTTEPVRLLDCVAGYCGALRLLRVRKSPLSVTEGLDAFLATVATVKRMGVAEAVKEWIAVRKLKTVAKQANARSSQKGMITTAGLFLRSSRRPSPATRSATWASNTWTFTSPPTLP